ncbi:MAG: MBL fold metallo-hydrolase [Lachnospiraceae bacterium]|jgi:metallo-beta-lactamase family protein|nr:MBL fold metallo-hydrolase [Lachnospiraceae bacterium]
MKVTFIGALHEVTGSCTLIESGGSAVLVDCGMEQGLNVFENVEIPVSPAEIDCVFLTHAHIDHSGHLPLLYKNGFRGKVYATEATTSLCGIMLLDSAHIQESDAEWKSRKAQRAGKPLVEPLYTVNDAEGVLKLFRPCHYDRKRQVEENICIRFSDMGHLLGSSAIEIWLTEDGVEKKIVFSGDVGNENQPIINAPKNIAEADYVVMESTYGNRLHGPRPDYAPALAAILQETFDRGGNVVIPSFAVGRTQEMLFFLRQIKEEGLVRGHEDFSVYVDSPLANEATRIFLQCDLENFDDEMKDLIHKGINPIWFKGLRVSVSQQDSMAINMDPSPKVILSASGMCEAGRIRHHLKHNLWRRECTILFVGYQAVGTLGRALCEGVRKVKLFDEEIAVEAQILQLPGVSGHADRDGLVKWLRGFENKPQRVFINHGDDDSCIAFTELLREEYGYEAVAPYSGAEFDLLADCFVREPAGVRVEHKVVTPGGAKAAALFGGLISAVRRLLGIAQNCQGRPNKDLKKFTGQVEKLCEEWED